METLTRNKNKGKTIIDWDLNVYSPEQWYGPEKGSYWDPDLWNINARIYSDGTAIDTEYTLTMLPKEAEAIGLVQFAKKTAESDLVGLVHDDWLDGGLDGFIDLYHFNQILLRLLVRTMKAFNSTAVPTTEALNWTISRLKIRFTASPCTVAIQ